MKIVPILVAWLLWLAGESLIPGIICVVWVFFNWDIVKLVIKG